MALDPADFGTNDSDEDAGAASYSVRQRTYKPRTECEAAVSRCKQASAMNRLSVRKVSAQGGMVGVLGMWLKARSSELWHLLDGLPGGANRPDWRYPGAVRILVADDNPVNLMVISAQLEALGVVPLLAADGAEAVALACQLHFDLILMDLQMPTLDGLAATSAIRRFEAHTLRRAVPVVAYSSTMPDADVLARHGIDGSLPKPCANDTLQQCLARWCPPSETEYADDSGDLPSQGWPPLRLKAPSSSTHHRHRLP